MGKAADLQNFSDPIVGGEGLGVQRETTCGRALIVIRASIADVRAAHCGRALHLRVPLHLLRVPALHECMAAFGAPALRLTPPTPSLHPQV